MKYWHEMGRCIAVGQVSKLNNKADYIIWCTTEFLGVGAATVDIQGWNLVSEIIDSPIRWTGPIYGRKVQNHQFDEDSLRDLSSLLQEFS